MDSRYVLGTPPGVNPPFAPNDATTLYGREVTLIVSKLMLDLFARGRGYPPGEVEHDVLSTLLVDLMHSADARGVDFESSLAIAREIHAEELAQ